MGYLVRSSASSVSFLLLLKANSIHRKNLEGHLEPWHLTKKLFVIVTESGEAELYNLVTLEFVAKIGHSTGPFRSIQLAIFYDRRSVALAHKQRPHTQDFDCQAPLEIIPKLATDGTSEAFQLRVITRPHPDVPIHSPGMLTMTSLQHHALICLSRAHIR